MEVFQCRKRMMVQAIVIPLSSDHGAAGTYEGPKTNKGCCQDKRDVECYLCHGWETDDAPPPALGVIMSVMSQFGLSFGDGELTFCTFCCSQLQHLVSLKQEADRTSQRLSTMVVGLHALVAMSTPPTQVRDFLAEEKQDEKDAPDNTPEGTTYSFDLDDVVDIDIKEEVEVVDGGHGSEEDEDKHISLDPDRFREATMTSSDKFIAEPSAVVPPRLVQTKMKGNRGRWFLCDVCGKTFTTKLTLKRHHIFHTGKRPRACPQCPYRSTKKANLDRHAETHLPPDQMRSMSFQCSRCPRQFRDNYHLKMHLNIHRVRANGKTWQCTLCSSTFGAKASLTSHVTASHQNVDREERATPASCSSTFGDPSI